VDSAGEIFAFQHDPEALGGNVYTVFDDESDGQSTLYSSSRAVTISLDLATDTATLIKSVNQPEGLTAGATGSAQTIKNGDLFVSWGAAIRHQLPGPLRADGRAPRGTGGSRRRADRLAELERAPVQPGRVRRPGLPVPSL